MMKIHAKIPCVYFKHNNFEIPNDQAFLAIEIFSAYFALSINIRFLITNT